MKCQHANCSIHTHGLTRWCRYHAQLLWAGQGVIDYETRTIVIQEPYEPVVIPFLKRTLKNVLAGILK